MRPPHDLEVETKSHYEADSLSPPRRVNGSKSSVLPHTNGINGGTHAVPNGRRPTTVTIEEVSDEDLPSPPKKQRPTAPPKFAARRPPPIIIEEVEDEDMPISESAIAVERPSQVVEPEEPEVRQRSTSPTATTSPFGSLPNGNAAARNTFGLKSSAPKAPSKLRYSFQADKEEKDSEKSHSQDAVPVPGIPTLPSFVQAFSSTAQTSKAALKTKAEVRAAVASMVVEDLPTFTFDIPTSSPGAGPGPSSQKARDAAKAISKSLLPTYNFDAEAIKPAPAPQFAAPAAPLPIAFDWSAAGMKKPEQSSGAGWTCTLCGLSNPGSATEQCTICEAPRPSKSGSAPIPAAAPAFTPPPAPTVKSFDWAGAGMKKPESSGSSTWTCSSCMLSNPASATDKCTVCDAPR